LTTEAHVPLSSVTSVRESFKVFPYILCRHWLCSLHSVHSSIKFFFSSIMVLFLNIFNFIVTLLCGVGGGGALSLVQLGYTVAVAKLVYKITSWNLWWQPWRCNM
jgi:hypothetical protein